MSKLIQSASVVLAAVFLGAGAPAPTGSNAAIEHAIARGVAMYEYDRAAWVTSDDLMTRLPPARSSEIGGWVVTQSPGAYHVDYFGKGASADRAIYSADVNDGKVSHATIYSADGEPILSQPALAMARALQAGWAEMERHPDWKPCANARFNTVVLPPESDGTVPVYFLTPQTMLDSFPFGGHYEVDISPDGRVRSERAFSRSCLTMSKPPLSAGTTPAFLFVTHLLDAQPTEVHVFEQLYVGVPLLVGIADTKTIWEVEDGKITDVTSLIKR